MRVFIGADWREPGAIHVATKTLARVSGLDAELLDVNVLQAKGLLTRLRDERTMREYDLVSNEHYSTRFNVARFLTPILCQSGMALFTDCDMVFYRDPREMMPRTYGSEKAVWVVKHQHDPSSSIKMAGQAQRAYARKNWSSVMLFDCDHPANRRLSLWDVNNRHRDDLHAFYWLADDEIGDLDLCWNWLVNEQPRPEHLGIAHFTNGGPFLEGWPGAPNDDLWLEAAK